MLRKRFTIRIALGIVVVCTLSLAATRSGRARSLFSLDQTVAERRKVLCTLLDSQREMIEVQEVFKDIVQRFGHTTALESENSLRERLNQMLVNHQMAEAVVTPSRAVEDPKSGIIRVPITVTAKGSLQATVGFMKDVAELPGLVRATNPAIMPSVSGRAGKNDDAMSLRIPLEVLILPSKGTFVTRENPDSTKLDEPYIRHENRDYSKIWNPNPFKEPQEVQQTQFVFDHPTVRELQLEETKRNVEPFEQPKTTPVLSERIVMTMARDDELTDRVEEIMVSNVHSNESRIVKVGDEFDGGRLVKVNSRQAYVEREGAYYSYALGGSSGQLVPGAASGR